MNPQGALERLGAGSIERSSSNGDGRIRPMSSLLVGSASFFGGSARKHGNLATDVFRKLFDGWPKDHLSFNPGPVSSRGKREGKYSTINRTLNDHDFALHMKGDASIGVSPLREDSTCLFGAIDIDLYPVDETQIDEIIGSCGTPCAVFPSKSKGLHLYVFTTEPVPASLMVDYLKMVRSRLPEAIQREAKEIFPKQIDVGKVKSPNKINLPMFGKQRELVFAYKCDQQIFRSEGDEDTATILRVIHDCCRISPEVMREALEKHPAVLDTKKAKQSSLPKSRRSRDNNGMGYRVPSDPAGRNDLLFRIAASMQARGWPDDNLAAEIRRLNLEGTDFHKVFIDGPLPDEEIDGIIKWILQQEKGHPADVHYRKIEEFNRSFAIIDLDGRQEFLNKKAEKLTTLSLADLRIKTATQRVAPKDRTVRLCDIWLQDVDRHEYEGIIIAPVDYDGPKYNLFRGLIEPAKGDIAPFSKLVHHLCGGDEKAIRWVMHWLADAVQRPTECGPATALALRGPQGHGKSLFRLILQDMTNDHYHVINDSSRFADRFNRDMLASLFLFAEEAIFAGSHQVAATLKSLIADPEWTYEEKYRAKFRAKNIHRVVAITNEEQAVHLDHDDRRWTICEVPSVWNLRTEAGKKERDAFFAPIYEFRNSGGAKHVMAHLMSINIDEALIRDGCMTVGKAEDAESSDPILATLVEIAITCVIPWDVNAEGKCSSAGFVQAVRDRDHYYREKPTTIMRRVKKMVGGESITSALRLEKIHTSADQNGTIQVDPVWNYGQRGVQWPVRGDFVNRLKQHAPHHDYPDGNWRPWTPPKLGSPISEEKAAEFAKLEKQSNKVDNPF